MTRPEKENPHYHKIRVEASTDESETIISINASAAKQEPENKHQYVAKKTHPFLSIPGG